MPERHDPGEEYAGAATVVTDDRRLDVTVRLRGHLEPIDGRFHWYGRIAADPALDDAVTSGSPVTLRTPYGDAPARLSDLDPWGRYRVGGTGRPPF